MFRNRILLAFPEEDIRALTPEMREIAIAKDETLLEQGSLASVLYFPSSAVISECVVLQDGRMLETNTVGFEGVVGLMSVMTDAPQWIRSFAQIAGSAIAIDAQAVRDRAAASPALHTLLMRALLLIQVQSQQSAACLAYHDTPRRLARWLLMTADRTGSSSFALTQEYMAVMLGIQRSSLNVAAAELKRRGVIRYSREM